MAEITNLFTVGKFVLPGDCVCIQDNDSDTTDTNLKIMLGPGLRRDANTVVATQSGIVRHRPPAVYWVDSHQKRYVPARGENVLGIVASKTMDVYHVDIGASERASLSYLAFEGSTKRNRPDVKIGDLVFARLAVANKDMEPELVCIDSNLRSSGFGAIRGGGFVMQTSLNLARKILSTQCNVLKALGNVFPYEIAVGMNGRIWVNGRSTRETIALAKAISDAELLNNEQIKVMVRMLSNSLAGF